MSLKSLPLVFRRRANCDLERLNDLVKDTEQGIVRARITSFCFILPEIMPPWAEHGASITAGLTPENTPRIFILISKQQPPHLYFCLSLGVYLATHPAPGTLSTHLREPFCKGVYWQDRQWKHWILIVFWKTF